MTDISNPELLEEPTATSAPSPMSYKTAGGQMSVWFDDDCLLVIKARRDLRGQILGLKSLELVGPREVMAEYLGPRRGDPNGYLTQRLYGFLQPQFAQYIKAAREFAQDSPAANAITATSEAAVLELQKDVARWLL